MPLNIAMALSPLLSSITLSHPRASSRPEQPGYRGRHRSGWVSLCILLAVPHSLECSNGYLTMEHGNDKTMVKYDENVFFRWKRGFFRKQKLCTQNSKSIFGGLWLTLHQHPRGADKTMRRPRRQVFRSFPLWPSLNSRKHGTQSQVRGTAGHRRPPRQYRRRCPGRRQSPEARCPDPRPGGKADAT